MKKCVLIVLVTIVISFILFWGGSIVKCEIITAQHGDEFLEFEEIKSATKFKILFYNDYGYGGDFAKIYCVHTDLNYAVGDIHDYVRKQGNIGEVNAWEHNLWHTVWSTAGSADEFVWPYIR